jgi:hypothetical protein
MNRVARKVLAGALLLLVSGPAFAQSQTSPPADTAAAPDADEGPTGKESTVGYIDSALTRNTFRLRYDAAYDFERPTRAEFFWARTINPGVPRPETRVDYQDLSSYLEVLVQPRLSLFVEGPYRFLNPQVNANTSGFSDMNTGFKWAFVNTPAWTTTLQLRTYIPTGTASHGLGTHHVSLEPALLVNRRVSAKFRLEGELRYWAPVGGTDFAGDIIRYGLGASYGQRNPDGFWVTPVVEFVGWTVLGGKESVAVSPTLFVVQSAAGDTIVNAKAGLRLGLGTRTDFYAGYGRALTGATWYTDTFRIEFRLFF